MVTSETRGRTRSFSMKQVGFAWWKREREGSHAWKTAGESQLESGDSASTATIAMMVRRGRAGRRTRRITGCCAPASANELREAGHAAVCGTTAHGDVVGAASKRRCGDAAAPKPCSASSRCSPPTTRETRATAGGGAGALRGAAKRKLERETRRRFREIDVDNDGFISECDIMRYAHARQLPKAYVRCFIKRAMRRDNRGNERDAHTRRTPTMMRTPCSHSPGTASLPPALQFLADVRRRLRPSAPTSSNCKLPCMAASASSLSSITGDGGDGSSRQPFGLTWDEFRSFSLQRDEVLARSFACLDADGDGMISFNELESGLTRCGKKHHRRKSDGVTQPLVRTLKRLRRLDHRGFQRRPISGSRTTKFNEDEFYDFCVLLPSPCMLLSYWTDGGCSSMDVGASVQLSHEVKKVRGGSLGHIVAGALAGAVSRSAVAPLETVRLRQMVHGKGSALGAALDLVRGEGIGGLWRGNLANVSKAAPQKALDFFTYDLLKRALTPRIGSGIMGSVQFFSGAVAGITSCVVLYPLENLRARIAVGSMKPAGVLSSLSMIARKEGVGSLYRGLGTSVCAIVPEAAITYGLFDILRQAGAEHLSQFSPELRAVGSGVVASLAGTLVAYPIETIARRLQTSPASLRLSTAFAEAMTAGGPRALYCGIVPMAIKVTPMAAISFFTYETVQGWLERISVDASTGRRKTTKEDVVGDTS